MNATELSGQIKKLIASNDWGEAARLLAQEWNDVSEFGVYHCEFPEQPEAMLKFKTTGYPFKLRRQWDETNDAVEILKLILPHVDRWTMRGASGEELPAPAECLDDVAKLDDLEEALVGWLVRSFREFWLVKLLAPRKN